MFQCIIVCCSVLRFQNPEYLVAIRGIALKCVVVHCSVWQCVVGSDSRIPAISACCPSRYSVLQCVAVCCSVLQCVAACGSVLQCVAVCCSVLR